MKLIYTAALTALALTANAETHEQFAQRMASKYGAANVSSQHTAPQAAAPAPAPTPQAAARPMPKMRYALPMRPHLPFPTGNRFEDLENAVQYQTDMAEYRAQQQSTYALCTAYADSASECVYILR